MAEYEEIVFLPSYRNVGYRTQDLNKGSIFIVVNMLPLGRNYDEQVYKTW